MRSNAEEKLAGSRDIPEELKQIPSESLLHELQVHQIELEMQNEELRNSRIALEEERNKYADLYEFAPVGYYTFDRKAMIKEVNLTGATLLGVERNKLINKSFRHFVAEEDLGKWDRYLINVFVMGREQSCDLKLILEDRSVFYARIGSIRILEKNGKPVVRTALTEITEMKKAADALRKYSDKLERNNKELQEALANVRSLSAMLPICASCKKIRDDKGYWKQVEAYISEHTDTVFSHGYCPECEEKAYEEVKLLKNK